MKNSSRTNKTTAKTRRRELPLDFIVLISPRCFRRRGGAAYIGVSPATFDAYRAQGLIREVPMPAVRGNGELRTPLFDRVDLDALIETLKKGRS